MQIIILHYRKHSAFILDISKSLRCTEYYSYPKFVLYFGWFSTGSFIRKNNNHIGMNFNQTFFPQ